MVWFGFFVERHINLHRSFNPKAIIEEEQQSYNLTHNWGKNEVHTFIKDISLKENMIVQLKFKLTYYNVALLLLCLRDSPWYCHVYLSMIIKPITLIYNNAQIRNIPNHNISEEFVAKLLKSLY